MNTNIGVSLTVVVPIKNMEGQLGNLKSWLGNALDVGAEVVLVLDGCTDKTKDELKALGYEGNPNYIVLHTNGEGPGAARNLGIKSATRKWIIFWDSDDIGHIPQIIECLTTLGETDPQVCVCGYRIAPNGYGTAESAYLEGDSICDIESALLNPGVWRIIFSREFIKDCTFGSGDMGEDQVFLARVLSKAPKIEFLDNQIYTYFKEIPTQLTSGRVKSKRIVTSIFEINLLIPGAESKTQKLLYMMLLRMNFSLLKRHPLSFVITSLKLIFGQLVKFKRFPALAFIKAITEILKITFKGAAN
jgi:glycosyltransferase involved in cell wall biosynthesis